MARYQMTDGMVVDTANASAQWYEATYHNGQNTISRATGGQWEHQKLYRSRRGRYYLESWSDWQGVKPSAEWISNEEAARWLLSQDKDLPDDLKSIADDLLD